MELLLILRIFLIIVANVDEIQRVGAVFQRHPHTVETIASNHTRIHINNKRRYTYITKSITRLTPSSNDCVGGPPRSPMLLSAV